MEKNQEFARNIRKNILLSAFKAGANGAHVAPSLSCVEILTAVYANVLKTENDGHFILSKGHAGLAYYAALRESGWISQKDFDSFEENGGDFPGQPSKNIKKHIEFSGGSLGMGLSYGIGLAIGSGQKVIVLIGDGEANEGSIWEASMFAGYNDLSNLTVIVDFNGMQADGFSCDILSVDVRKMWEACGWEVVVCDGHKTDEITKALMKEHKKPLVVIAKTIKGKGVSFMENNRDWHHARLTEKQKEAALAEVEAGYGF